MALARGDKPTASVLKTGHLHILFSFINIICIIFLLLLMYYLRHHFTSYLNKLTHPMLDPYAAHRGPVFGNAPAGPKHP